MKTIKFKSSSTGHLSLAHPSCKVGTGVAGRYVILAVENIPENISTAEVLRGLEQTILPSFIHLVDFTQLRKNLYNEVEQNDQQREAGRAFFAGAF